MKTLKAFINMLKKGGVLSLFVSVNSYAFFVEQETPSYVLPEEMALDIAPHTSEGEKIQNFYQEHSPLFHRIKNQLGYWEELDEQAARWGLDEAGLYTGVSRKAKLAVIEREVFRYFKRQTREPLKDQLSAWRRGLTRDYEIDEMRQINDQDSVFVYDRESYQAYLDEKERKENKKNHSGKKGVDKKIKIAKEYKIRIKPRVLKGILVTDLKTPYANINSVLGVNREFTINISRAFVKAKLYTSLHYNMKEGIILASMDKRIGDHLTMRISTIQDKTRNIDFSDATLLSFNFFSKF